MIDTTVVGEMGTEAHDAEAVQLGHIAQRYVQAWQGALVAPTQVADAESEDSDGFEFDRGLVLTDDDEDDVFVDMDVDMGVQRSMDESGAEVEGGHDDDDDDDWSNTSDSGSEFDPELVGQALAELDLADGEDKSNRSVHAAPSSDDVSGAQDATEAAACRHRCGRRCHGTRGLACRHEGINVACGSGETSRA